MQTRYREEFKEQALSKVLQRGDNKARMTKPVALAESSGALS